LQVWSAALPKAIEWHSGRLKTAPRDLGVRAQYEGRN
jgi:hypothetical protein